MTTKLTKQLLGGESYISPEIRAVEFKAEGPLCMSVTAFSIAEWQYDDSSDDILNF